MEALGVALSYPGAGFPDAVARARAELAGAPPESRERFERFGELSLSKDPRELEELYTRTFDLNPDCSLEIGWHLYGEQYERGAFLVEMREKMKRLGVPEDSELPDHLSHALAVLARLEPAAARRFAHEALLPALRKILKPLEDTENPYRLALQALLGALEARS